MTEVTAKKVILKNKEGQYLLPYTDTYTKSETDTLLTDKADKSGLDGAYISKTKTLSTSTKIGKYTVNLADYLPADNNNYFVLIRYASYSTGNMSNVYVTTALMSRRQVLISSREVQNQLNTFLTPVGTNRIVILEVENTDLASFVVEALGYRKMGGV